MTSSILFEYSDDDGCNPTGEPGDFTFNIEYSYTKGCAARINFDENDHPAEASEVEVLTVDLVDDGMLRYNDSIKRNIENWFMTIIRTHETICRAIYEQVCDEVEQDRQYHLEEKYYQVGCVIPS